MTSRASLLLVVLSALMIGSAYASAFLPGGAPAWAPWVFMLGTSTILLSIAALGATRTGRTLGRLHVPFAITFAILIGCFTLALALPETDVTTPQLFLGLPRRAAAILYGIGILPMLVLPWAYAWTFDDMTLSEEDWARVRKAADEYRATHPVSS
jgi:hypothetical protein